ncbi:hypothetical protein chiPu_0029834, partial [Chiloscyllium punctatum]|nr:hypothetical protein [Chiloscyllium punctatum]
EPAGGAAEGPPADQELRQYIESRLVEQVSRLRTAVEGQLRDGEQRLNQKLLALETPSLARGEAKSPRSRKK